MRRLWVLLAAAIATGCNAEANTRKDPVRPVLTMIAGGDASDSDGSRVFVGTLQPRQSTQLAFRVGGRIVRRAVTVGDHVKKGDVIATLDTRSLAYAVGAAEANLAAVQASRNNAETNRARQLELRRRDAVSQAVYDNALTSHDTATAAVNEARARLAKAQEDLGYGTLRAEIDGVVTVVNFEVEQTVAPNAVIAELANPDALDVVVDVPESAAFELGDVLLVRSDTDDAPHTSGTVRQVSPIADQTTRTRRVWVAIAPTFPGVRFGSTMYAWRPQGKHAQLKVPASAIFELDGQSFVWIVDTEHHTRPRSVELGTRDGDQLHVVSGITHGERIVVAGVHALTPGQQVRVDGARP